MKCFHLFCSSHNALQKVKHSLKINCNVLSEVVNENFVNWYGYNQYKAVILMHFVCYPLLNMEVNTNENMVKQKNKNKIYHGLK